METTFDALRQKTILHSELVNGFDMFLPHSIGCMLCVCDHLPVSSDTIHIQLKLVNLFNGVRPIVYTNDHQ